MGTKIADYGVAGLENPDFPHCEKGLLKYVQDETDLNEMKSTLYGKIHVIPVSIAGSPWKKVQ